MPGFDGGGPAGEGPMTGWGRGYCNPGNAGYGGPVPRRGYGGMGFGRGFRGGAGFGRGFGRGYVQGYAPYHAAYPVSVPDELEMLKQQAESVKSTLDAINTRISELEKE